MGDTILGFFGPENKWTHDHSMTVLEDNQISTYLQLERITRKKFDNRLPSKLGPIITNLGIANNGIDEIKIGYANSFSLEPEKFLKVSDNNIFSTKNDIEIKHKGSNSLKVETVTGRFLNTKIETTIVPHELAHVFSLLPFYGTFKNKSLLVHVDGAASISNASVWFFHNNQIQLLEKTTLFHHALLNFSYNDLTFDILKIPHSHHLSMPGKLMGFASYGTSSQKLLSWLRSNNFFRDYTTHSRVEFLQGAKDLFNYDKKTIITKHRLSYDIAACMQKHFENVIFSFIEKYKHHTGSDYLYYAGGAALNIKLNAKIVNSNLFKEIFIPPPAGDSGLSLGVVAYLNWKNKKTMKTGNVYLNNYNLISERYSPNFSIDEICRRLKKGQVIGIYQGFGEAGPRALGHRSILANPCLKKMMTRVSMDLKKREWYRPLAPIVLESQIEDLFEHYTKSKIMKYMLYEFNVKSTIQDKIPAVVHVDGTARAQIVEENDRDLQLIIDILKTARDDHDIPCLINTSFNMAGEPIVHTQKEALQSAKKMGLDGVILDNKYIHLRN